MSRTKHHISRGRWEERVSYYHYFSKEPKWWRKIFKHRKRRAELRHALTKLRQGADIDNIVWPKDKQPWIYYW